MAEKSCDALYAVLLMNEKMVLEELQDCPEIVRCFGDSFNFENGQKLYNVLLEYASGGSLADKLKNSSQHRLSELDIRRYTKSLLSSSKCLPIVQHHINSPTNYE
ncbi:unnamed protein product [Ilex paraguariensis]|uniref:Uncharacterized protein n=1 Tax=Ilex paraguariensis TaxID=185542 RepID=A0ABC8R673_9AQUA